MKLQSILYICVRMMSGRERCSYAPMLLCSYAPMLLCSYAPMLLCSSAPMLLCSYAPMLLCVCCSYTTASVPLLYIFVAVCRVSYSYTHSMQSTMLLCSCCSYTTASVPLLYISTTVYICHYCIYASSYSYITVATLLYLQTNEERCLVGSRSIRTYI